MANVISPPELLSLVQQGKSLELIDVRTPAEFQEVHVTCARNVPLDRLDPAHEVQTLAQPSQPIYVICKSGGRGRQAVDAFTQAGFANVFNVDGGTTACAAAGLPVVRGKKVMSLERQVRIAAGSLVLVGIGLSFLHPYLIGLSAFVGAGLVFAGITDTCGMGLVLARMPWNQVSGKI